MPANQRRSVLKRGSRWAARFYDEAGARQFQSGFDTRSEARAWVDDKVDEIDALRRGERPKALGDPDREQTRRERPCLA